jgi:hypothetical protein
MTPNDLNRVLKTSAPQEEGFKEVRRRKRHNSEEAACTAKTAAIPTSCTKVITKNFAPLRTMNMGTDAPGTDSKQLRKQFQEKQAGRLR